MLRVNFVTSIDGAVAVDGRSAGLSGDADKAVFRMLRSVCDAVLVGAGTYRAENYTPLILRGSPRLVVVSRGMRLTFPPAPARPIVLTTTQADPGGLQAVADIVRCTDLADGLAKLREMGLVNILCEGGPYLFGELSNADLVDELCLTVSPLLAGPGAGRITAGEIHPVRRMRLSRMDIADDGTLLLRYERQRGF